MIADYSKNLNSSLNGMPTLRWNTIQASANGLISQNSKKGSSDLIEFGKEIRDQLN